MTAHQGPLWMSVDVPADKHLIRLYAQALQLHDGHDKQVTCMSCCLYTFVELYLSIIDTTHQAPLICEIAIASNQYVVSYALPEHLNA